MIDTNIALRRLHQQRLSHNPLATPEEVVEWLGAVQSQDYLGAKWALGLRMQNATDDVISQAFNAGTILRTHVMRPAWHFVTPADIRWMLALTAPRVNALNAYMYRQQELDDSLFGRSNEVIARALEGGKHLTRMELGAALAQAGIIAETMRLGYILHHAELDAVVCSGPRRGKQFTYALLDERAPQARTLARDEALAELVRRYFQSHGPATAHDFSWWSGQTVADARAGIEMVKSQLHQEIINGQTYWSAASLPAASVPPPTVHLLPNYDEYISYKDRSAVFDSRYEYKLDATISRAFPHLTVIDGQIVGTWRRTFQKGMVVIESSPFDPLTDAQYHAVADAAQRYGAFLEMPVVLA